MTKIILYLAIIIALAVTVVTVQAQTNTLTDSQVTQLNQGIDNLLPLIPVQYQPLAVKAISIMALLAFVGRIYEGYRTGGVAGVFHSLFTSRTPDSAATAVPIKGGSNLMSRLAILSAAGIAIFALAGCTGPKFPARHQVINNSVIHGFNAEASVPIPYSGGESFLMLKLQGGVLQNNQIVQPISTNRTYCPPVVIYQNSRGAVGVNGGAGSNSLAAINDGQTDRNIIDTSRGVVSSTNGEEFIDISPPAPVIVTNQPNTTTNTP